MGTVAHSNSHVAAKKLKDAGLLLSRALIGDKWCDAIDGRTLNVTNPATGELLTSVPFMGRKETELAITAAHEAFPAWSQKTNTERSKLLRKWFDLLIQNKEELGRLMTLEQGKPLKEALGEVAPALAAGCTIIVKPSEFTPLSAMAAAKLAVEAGIPAGVLNIVTGDAPQIGAALLESTRVRKITFTGSTQIGKKLMEGSAATVKKVSLELGGNAPCIIFDDANIDLAVKGALAAKYRNSGQTCVCVNRIFVQDGIYAEFAKAFALAVSQLQVGNGLDEGVTQGPLINPAAVVKVESHVEDAVAKGAKVLTGGKKHSLGRTFYEPTVLADATVDMRIFSEEVFGPVAPLIRFKDDKEAVAMANDTEFGLASYIFTENITRGWRIAEALEYGMVGLNEGLISTEVAPFGGMKQSGLGREGSKYGLDEYLETLELQWDRVQRRVDIF
ncbi:hypothetical protein AXG93_1433s1080 [Marchantia polymorpha subsp. ruderalis]|uniref:Succinate-semialdehyde dehydrogenase, mitochondrial n=1 Tax=Marchantia polymorpha subsp. ruderalis TaxID=1480154 RepID=A0A176W8S0_MARPO|nr:hypothetical protein AXG93_1433s1080 [Marchantia polymorpha subsp. ruderalis]